MEKSKYAIEIKVEKNEITLWNISLISVIGMINGKEVIHLNNHVHQTWGVGESRCFPHNFEESQAISECISQAIAKAIELGAPSAFHEESKAPAPTRPDLENIDILKRAVHPQLVAVADICRNQGRVCVATVQRRMNISFNHAMVLCKLTLDAGMFKGLELSAAVTSPKAAAA